MQTSRPTTKVNTMDAHYQQSKRVRRPTRPFDPNAHGTVLHKRKRTLDQEEKSQATKSLTYEDDAKSKTIDCDDAENDASRSKAVDECAVSAAEIVAFGKTVDGLVIDISNLDELACHETLEGDARRAPVTNNNNKKRRTIKLDSSMAITLARFPNTRLKAFNEIIQARFYKQKRRRASTFTVYKRKRYSEHETSENNALKTPPSVKVSDLDESCSVEIACTPMTDQEEIDAWFAKLGD